MRLLAVDDDIGTNALLKFAITGGNEGSFFTIDSGTGNFLFSVDFYDLPSLSMIRFLFREERFKIGLTVTKYRNIGFICNNLNYEMKESQSGKSYSSRLTCSFCDKLDS